MMVSITNLWRDKKSDIKARLQNAQLNVSDMKMVFYTSPMLNASLI